eukprot:2419690-Pyramimonas_sp.AAC.1
MRLLLPHLVAEPGPAGEPWAVTADREGRGRSLLESLRQAGLAPTGGATRGDARGRSARHGIQHGGDRRRERDRRASSWSGRWDGHPFS